MILVPQRRFSDFRPDPNLLGSLPHMRQGGSQWGWNVVGKALDGETLDATELEWWRLRTGLETPRASYSELIVRCGRQAGKTRWAADRAVFRAFTAPNDGSARGLYVALIAQDSRAAMRVLFNYVVEAIDASEALRAQVVSRTTTTVLLKNGVTIAVYPCRPAALRGIRCLAIYIDEFQHFVSTDGNPVGQRMLTACRPTLAMQSNIAGGGELVILSSPGGQSGAFYELDRQFYGKDGTTLVIAGGALDFNPLLPASYIETFRANDPAAALSEIDGQFSAALSDLFDAAAVDACVGDYREREREPGVHYRVGGDISGGRRDATAFSCAHDEGGHTVVDWVRAWPSPHNPDQVIAEAAALARAWGCCEIVADRYGAQHPVAAFQRHGVRLVPSELDRSSLYLELLPKVLAQKVTIPNDPPLLRELKGLQRTRGQNRDRVDHRSSAMDDRANAMALAVYLVAGRPQYRSGMARVVWG